MSLFRPLMTGILVVSALLAGCKNATEPQPAASLGHDTLQVTVELGSTPQPVAVDLVNSGGGVLSQPVCSIQYGAIAAGWLQAVPTGAGNAQQITNTISMVGLLEGTYSAIVTVTVAGAANSPLKYAVILSVLRVTATLSVDTLRFTADMGLASPPPATLALSNSGAGTLNNATYIIQYTAGTPNWLQASASGSGNAQQISNAAAISGVPVGTHTALVTIVVSNAVNSPLPLVVILTILQPGPSLFVSVDSLEGIPNAPDAITQASPVPKSINIQVDAPADPTDSLQRVFLNSGDDDTKQWLGAQIPVGLEFSYGNWWNRSGLCTVKVEATTVKGGVSDTSIVCRVLTRDEYYAAAGKRAK